MKNRRRTDGGRRSVDRVAAGLNDLRLQTTALVERVNHLSSVNEGMRAITDQLIKQMTNNTLNIVKSGVDLESRINKWMVALVVFIASGTAGVVMLVIEMGIGK